MRNTLLYIWYMAKICETQADSPTVSQGCRIKVSIVSNKSRSVVLNNIVMIIRHNLGERKLVMLGKASSMSGGRRGDDFSRSLKVLLTSKGWPMTRKSHILRLPALGPNLSSSHSLSCTWSWVVFTYHSKIWLLYQRSIAHEADEEPGFEHPQWNGHSVLVEKWGDKEDHSDRRTARPAWRRIGCNVCFSLQKNLLQEVVCRCAWETIDEQADSSLAKTLRSLGSSTSRGRSPGRQRREVLRRYLGRSGRGGSLPAARWCGSALPACEKC